MKTKLLYLFFLTLIITISNSIKSGQEPEKNLILLTFSSYSPLKNSALIGNGGHDKIEKEYYILENNVSRDRRFGIKFLKKNNEISINLGSFCIEELQDEANKVPDFYINTCLYQQEKIRYPFTQEKNPKTYQFLSELLGMSLKKNHQYSAAAFRTNSEHKNAFCITYATISENESGKKINISSILLKIQDNSSLSCNKSVQTIRLKKAYSLPQIEIPNDFEFNEKGKLKKLEISLNKID